jgi:hypothetical protein
MTLLLLALLAAAAPAGASGSAAPRAAEVSLFREGDSELIATALRRLLDLEQSIPRGGLEGQTKWETAFREKTTETMKPLARLLRAHDLRVKPVPEDWLTLRAKSHAWPGAEGWAKDFEKLDETRRCGRARLAYAFGIWQLTGLTAEQPVKELNDLLVRDYTNVDMLWRDRARAGWAFRHAHAIPMDKVPAACADDVKDVPARWDYIFDADKRPTGLARFMCGRPMNSHWADDDIDAKKRPEPKGWTKPVD